MLSDAKKLWQKAKNCILKKTIEKGIPQNEDGVKGGDRNSNTAKESSASSSTPSAFTWASRPVDKPKVRGFESQILSLRKLLGDRENDRQFKAVGVVGARGVGKTALCQVQFYGDDLLITANKQTANDEKSTAAMMRRPKSSFFPRAWMRVSTTRPNEEKVIPTKIEQIKGALERLGVEGRISDSIEENMKLKVLLYVLRRRLIGKKYLIVLDDVQSTDKWQENLSEATSFPIRSGSHPESEASLACGLPKGSGGTVIITSRDEKNVEKMVKEGHRDIHCVLPLSDPKSLWEIFKDAIFELSDKKNSREILWNILKDRLEKVTSSKRQLFGEKIDTMKTLEEKVVSKCNGLPLAARLTAETMLELLVQREEELEELAKIRKVRMEKNGKVKGSDVIEDGKVSREEEDKKVEDKDGSLRGHAEEEKVRENVVQDKMQEESVDENVEEKIKDDAEKKTEEVQGQEGKGSESEVASQKIEDEYHKEEKQTSGENKEENHPEEETVMKEEYEETAVKTGVKDTSREKEDRKDVEMEKDPEKNKQVQGEEIMHDEKASTPKKEDDQKEKETEKDQVVPRKEEKEEEATEEVSKKSPQSEEVAKVEEEVLEKKELQEKPEKDAEENKSSTEEAVPKKEE